MDDTINFVRHIGEAERVVRPALAMLYRIALGPQADRYVRRFLEYERLGWAKPYWHWPAFLFPAVWASYRRMYAVAFGLGVLPLVGAMAFGASVHQLSPTDAIWWGWAAMLIALVPGLIGSVVAYPLLYRSIRRLAQAAEAESAGGAQAAAQLAARPSISLVGACLALLAMVAVAGAVYIDLKDAHREREIRRQVATTLDAVRVLQQRIEDTWTTSRLVPKQTTAVQATPGVLALVDDVNVSPSNGRLKLAFGSKVSELAGKVILLAPAQDAQGHVRWLCVAVGIAPHYLPHECVQG